MQLSNLFFNSLEFKQASTDAIVVYMVLRNDAVDCVSSGAKQKKESKVLGSGFTSEEIAENTSISLVTVKRSLEELIKRKWIKKDSGYTLGFIEEVECKWFLDNRLFETKVDDLGLPDALRASEKLRRKLNEDRKGRKFRVSDEAKRKVVGTVFPENEEIRPKDIIKKFKSLYKDKFGRECPMIEAGPNSNKYATTYVYVGRAIQWASSRQEVLDVVDMIFDKWEELKEGLSLDGTPSLHMLGSSKLYPRFASCLKEGIPKRKKRYNREDITDRSDNDGKDVGW